MKIIEVFTGMTWSGDQWWGGGRWRSPDCIQSQGLNVQTPPEVRALHERELRASGPPPQGKVPLCAVLWLDPVLRLFGAKEGDQELVVSLDVVAKPRVSFDRPAKGGGHVTFDFNFMRSGAFSHVEVVLLSYWYDEPLLEWLKRSAPRVLPDFNVEVLDCGYDC